MSSLFTQASKLITPKFQSFLNPQLYYHLFDLLFCKVEFYPLLKSLGITFSFHLEDLSKNWGTSFALFPILLLPILTSKALFFLKLSPLTNIFFQKIFFCRELSFPLPNNSRLKLLCYLNFYETTLLLNPLKDVPYPT